MLKVDGSTLATILWAMEQEGVTEDELLCLSDPRCKKRVARILRDFRNAQLRKQGENEKAKVNFVDHFGNVVNGVGSVIEIKGALCEVVGAKMRVINLESHCLEGYEEGEIPWWVEEVIKKHGKYMPPDGYNFVHYAWAVGADDCFTALVLRVLSQGKEVSDATD